jgi:hypothetical protein
VSVGLLVSPSRRERRFSIETQSTWFGCAPGRKIESFVYCFVVFATPNNEKSQRLLTELLLVFW